MKFKPFVFTRGQYGYTLALDALQVAYQLGAELRANIALEKHFKFIGEYV